MIGVDQESVIRLRLSAETARSVVRRPPIHDWLAGRPRSRRLAATYYDTEDEALRKGAIALSIKEGDRQRAQIAASNAVSVSSVLEAGAAPDLARIRDADIRTRALRLASDAALSPVFQADFRIRAYTLALEGIPVEMTLSVGQIFASDIVDEFAEIAFRATDRMAAYRAAEGLAAAIPVSVERRDFIARGYDLAHGRHAQAALARDVALDDGWNARPASWRSCAVVSIRLPPIEIALMA